MSKTNIFSPSSLSLLLLLVVVSAARPPLACDPRDSKSKDFAFCKASLPVAERVRDLIGRLTLQEKVKLLVNNAAAVPRLGMRGYEWWSEALHGVSNVGPGTKFGGAFPGATSFPQVISTAASFNSSLWEKIGRVVSDEARAMLRLVASTTRPTTSITGGGVDRFHFNARVSKQDIKDTFEIPFRECVLGGKVASVMCSYNQVNGIPTCADPKLLKGTIRGSWRLNGYIVSDCDSVGVFFENQHYTSKPEEAVAAAIKAGLDLDCGPFLAIHTEDAIKRGILREADVDGALVNTVAVQMRLGMFDGEPSAHRYGSLGPRDVCSLAHQELALEAARQGIVLLKNRGPSLPLSPRRHRTVAVIGPNSDVTVTMIGNYAGVACGYTTPLQGIGRYTKTIHQQGCKDVACTTDHLFGAAIDAAREADATVLVMGLDQSIEAEFRDRAGLLLPGRQQKLLSRVSKASKGPTILVLMSGGPVDVSFAKNDPRIGAIVWAGYPGQAGGAAIADVLFGTHNPGGKLPMTWYPQDYLTKLPMTTMDMRSNPSKGYPGRTYRFYSGPVVYPFGYGISYSNFVHTITDAPTVVAVPLHGHRQGLNTTAFTTTSGKSIRVTHAKCNKLSIGLRVNVKNAGSRDGSHTLLVFSTPPGGHWAPHKQLVAFEKVHVAAGAQQRVHVNIHVCKYLSVVDRSGIRRIPMGQHSLHIGDIRHAISLQAAALGVIKS
ncbi:beta-xylosidase 2 [Actinidia rufa]|uniref:Beta-xylosidase 2 n=1 Tax=Actinidia rufa TaxID=165716 RepID=A0A7J0G194_9ERIC|nr:beta-xylosidase 2 [Actinidia rufa]